MVFFNFKQTVVQVSTCIFLLTSLLNISRGQKPLQDFSNENPSDCGSIQTLNPDDVFFINDFISSEGRKSKAFESRSKGQKYLSKPVQSDDFQEKHSYVPPLTLSQLASLESPSSAFETDEKRTFLDYSDMIKLKNNSSNNKKEGMFRDLGDVDDAGSVTDEEEPEKPREFFNFMLKTYDRPYKSEKRKFPGQPSRVAETRRTKKPLKKDMMTGLDGKVKGKKRNSSHAERREKSTKFPVFVQHLLDTTSKQNNTPAVPPAATSAGYQFPDYSQQFKTRQGPTSPRRSPGPDGGNMMDILSGLGPDKIQQIKQYLGTVGPSQNVGSGGGGGGGGGGRNRDHDRGFYNGDRDRDYDYSGASSRSGPYRREDNSGGMYRSKPYNSMDTRPSEYKSLPYSGSERSKRPMAGSSSDSGDRYHKSREMEHDTHDSMYPGSSEFSEDGKIPDAVVTKKKNPHRRRIRLKRDVSGERKSSSRRRRNDDGNNEMATCRWLFRKGTDCKRLVVKMQYWIDGVRDCNKEYISIKGNGRAEEDVRLCEAQENLKPYVVEGEKVFIKHFKEPSAGPGMTKFKGTIQCEQ